MMGGKRGAATGLAYGESGVPGAYLFLKRMALCVTTTTLQPGLCCNVEGPIC